MKNKTLWKKRGLALLMGTSLVFGNLASVGAAFEDAAPVSDVQTETDVDFSIEEEDSGTAPKDNFQDGDSESSADGTDNGSDDGTSDSSTGGISGSSADGASTPSTNGASDSSVQEDELFSSGEESEFSSGSAESEPDYILGRPMTETERQEQLAAMNGLTATAPAEDADSDLSISMFANSVPYYNSADQGLVSSVKNQNPFNICWAFGLASNFETSLLQQGLGEWDLSEEHLAYFFSHRENDPLGNTPDDRLIHLGKDYHDAGNGMVASFFLSTWSGMVTENKVPLPTDASHSADLSKPLDPALAYDTDVYLEDAVFSGYSKDSLDGSVSRVKLLLGQYGSVTGMIYMDSTGHYYQADTAADCYPFSGLVNHAITIVGWDDNYSKDNFPAASGVQNDGAWIVKNSYGPSWGKNGYFYLSYEDASLKNLVSNTVTTDPKYPNNYFYDGASAGATSVKMKKGSSIATIFHADAGNGKGEELGELVLASKSDYADFQIQIYTNLKNPADPTSGTPVYQEPLTYTQALAGIDTVELPSPVKLVQGSSYSIIVTNAGASDISYYVESTTTAGTNTWFQAVAGLSENQSFSSSNGSTWADTSKSKTPYCVSLKAHTRTLDGPLPTPTPVPTATPAPKPTATPTPKPTATPKPQTYKVTYHKNTRLSVGNMPSDKTSYVSGKSVKVKSGPYCNSAFFVGWNTRADGRGTGIAPGKSFRITKNTTLYAQWRTSYTSSSKLKYRVTGNGVTCYGTSDPNIRTVSIPSTIRYANITYRVISVWEKAFRNKTKLTRVTIGDNVTAIGDNAFSGCKSLNSVTIGKSLWRIGPCAFRSVKKGCTITLKTTKLTKISTRIDQSVSKMVIRVPKKSLNSYKKLFKKNSKTVTVKGY